MTSFPKRKILEVQKSLGITGPTYTCPLCASPFHQEPKLWLHAKESHPGSLEAIGLSTEAEAKERESFKQQAIQSAQNKPIPSRKPTTERAPLENESDMNKMVPPSPPRPQTAPEQEGRPAQNPPHVRHLDQHQARISAAGVPQKRGAGQGGSVSPDPSADPATPNPHTRARHNKSYSSGNIQDSDFARRHGSGRLFDPTMDDSPRTVNPNRQRSPKNRGHQGRASRGRNVEPRQREGLHESSRKVKPPWSSRQATKGTSSALQPDVVGLQKPGQPILLQKREGGYERDISPPDDPDEQEDDPEPDPSMLVQPETRPISHDQLVVEVKGIYAGLVMVEAKCIEVDEKQTPSDPEKSLSRGVSLKNDQWRSLIALHKQLLHEHHDFFLASQHPSASSNLSKLAGKYSMPARMWRHGIHGFLEVLRHRLPGAFEHMLAFIYIAYSMMALLYETVPSFEDTWVECLGDLARYRMAIEEEEPRDRETWSGVARYWYSKASHKTPSVGRLYHHLAILAPTYTIEQLSLYTKALTCITPFESTRGSIMTLFKPLINHESFQFNRAFEFERFVGETHGNLFLYTQKTAKDKKKKNSQTSTETPEESSEETWDASSESDSSDESSEETAKENEEALQLLRSFDDARTKVLNTLESWVKCVMLDRRRQKETNEEDSGKEVFDKEDSNREEINKTKLKKTLAFFAMSNISGILQYGVLTDKGDSGSLVRRAYDAAHHHQRLQAMAKMAEDDPESVSSLGPPNISTEKIDPANFKQSRLSKKRLKASRQTTERASEFAFSIFRYAIAEQHWVKNDWYFKEDLWILFLSHIHIMTALLFGLYRLASEAVTVFEDKVPWTSLCEFLTRLQFWPGAATARVRESEFPRPDNEPSRPLWEDFIIRGSIFDYFPDTWFSNTTLDDEERQLEVPSMNVGRMERVLWLGHMLAALNKWIRYDTNTKTFNPIVRTEDDLKENTTGSEDVDSTAGAHVKDADTVMADAPFAAAISPERTSIAPSEAPEASIISTDDSSTTLTPRPSSSGVAPRFDPSTPTMVGADERDDDIPMMDISPNKEHPPDDPSNPVGATAWDPGPVTDTQSATLPMDAQATQAVNETSKNDHLRHLKSHAL